MLVGLKVVFTLSSARKIGVVLFHNIITYHAVFLSQYQLHPESSNIYHMIIMSMDPWTDCTLSVPPDFYFDDYFENFESHI